jgi:hypothetical protein
MKLVNPLIEGARLLGNAKHPWVIIDPDGFGEYANVNAAFAALGACSVFLRDGVYSDPDQRVVFTAAYQHVIGQSWNAHVSGGILFHPFNMNGAAAYSQCSVRNLQASTTSGGGGGTMPFYWEYGAQPGNFTIENCWISNSDSHGVRFAGNGNQINRPVIRNCRIQGCDGDGINLGWCLYGEVSNNLLRGCTQHGLQMDGNADGINVVGNVFEGNSHGDIHTYGDNAVINSNMCYHATNAIHLDGTAQNNSVNNNIVNAATTDAGAGNDVNDNVF